NISRSSKPSYAGPCGQGPDLRRVDLGRRHDRGDCTANRPQPTQCAQGPPFQRGWYGETRGCALQARDSQLKRSNFWNAPLGRLRDELLTPELPAQPSYVVCSSQRLPNNRDL